MGEKLTIPERVKLVFMFAKDEATYRSVAEEFTRTYPEREKPLSHTTVIRINKRFQETGSVADSFIKGTDAVSMQRVKNLSICYDYY